MRMVFVHAHLCSMPDERAHVAYLTAAFCAATEPILGMARLLY